MLIACVVTNTGACPFNLCVRANLFLPHACPRPVPLPSSKPQTVCPTLGFLECRASWAGLLFPRIHVPVCCNPRFPPAQHLRAKESNQLCAVRPSSHPTPLICTDSFSSGHRCLPTPPNSPAVAPPCYPRMPCVVQPHHHLIAPRVCCNVPETCSVSAARACRHFSTM